MSEPTTLEEISELKEEISELKEENSGLRKENSELRKEIERLRGLVMPPSDLSIDVVVGNPPYSSFSSEMVKIEPCTFMMGALGEDEDADDDEKPRHEVKLTRSFAVGKYQVTQALWESVMGNNPSEFKGKDRPVECVSWFDCVDFCNKLSEKEGLEKAYTTNGSEVSQNLDAKGYRLPTEAEWECAARGGEYHLYAGSDNIDEVAWTRENSNKQTHGVGQKKANGFGLYDMSGNVWEWVWDWWDDDTDDYSNASSEDPTGPSTGSYRVFRGGGWYFGASYARVSARSRYRPSHRSKLQGFRLFRTTS
jgi:sulfatase modifying factor 1